MAASRTEPASSSARTPVSYADFGAWYEPYREAVLEPALAAASESLDAMLRDALSDRDLTRIRRSSGRVKSKRRAWRKLRPARRDGLINSVDDIPAHVHDLVGLRLTCTNLRDIDMVQAALDNLPAPGPRQTGLCLDPASERDYVLMPKDSGYRGWHISLSIGVEVDGKVRPVTCELQVRTLLQDSWGELTHEDTYSKDGALPPLVEVLSKRMADLFATLDDIAEDLRSELDRLDEIAVAESDNADPAAEDAVAVDAAFEQAADAASFVHDRWTRIDRPTDLASLAWELQREFGAEVSDDWFGAGTFKRFLSTAIPDAEISTGRQRYLLPPTVTPEVAEAEAEADVEADTPDPSSIPDAARQLRRIDSRFPLLPTTEWTFLYAEMAAAWQRLGTITPTARNINALTRTARDGAEEAGRTRSRRHLDYVTKAIMSLDDAGKPMSANAIAEAFSTLTLQRMADLRVLSARNKKRRTAVQAWLGS